MFLINIVCLISISLSHISCVSQNIYNVVDTNSKHHNTTLLQTLDNIWKTGRRSQTWLPPAKSNFNSVPFTSHLPLSDRSSKAPTNRMSYVHEGQNSFNNMSKRRIKDILSKQLPLNQDSFLKQKRQLQNHMNGLKHNLRKEQNKQKSLSKERSKIKHNVAKSINSDKTLHNFLVKKVKPVFSTKVKKSQNKSKERLGQGFYAPNKSQKKNQTLNANNTTWDNGTHYFSNCTKKNNRCRTVKPFDDKRRDRILFDFEKSHENIKNFETPAISNPPQTAMGLEFYETNKPHVVKKVLQNVSTNIPESIQRVLSLNALEEEEGADSLPHVVKERGMLEKFFALGNSNGEDKTAETNKYGTHEKKENKQNTLKSIANKFQYMLPFLSGFSKGMNKVLTKPQQRSPYQQSHKYGPAVESFLSLSHKPKALFRPSPFILRPKKPIFLSELLKASKTKMKGIPVPYNVAVEKRVPYFIKLPYDNSVPVHVSQPYGVPVRVKVPGPYPVTKIVKNPYKVHAENPVPVKVEQLYPLLKEKVKPYTVETAVNKPYNDPMYNDYTAALTYDKNIPYPGTTENADDHKLTLADLENEQLQPEQENLAPDDIPEGADLRPSFHEPAYVSTQKPLRNSDFTANTDNEDHTSEQKMPFHYTGNKTPKDIKSVKSTAPITYADAMKALIKTKGHGLTEAQILNLMKYSQTRDKVKQIQILNEAFQRSMLQRLNVQVMKENQLLKAALAQTRPIVEPQYETKQVYPEFKPIEENMKIPVIPNENDDYDTESNAQGEEPVQVQNSHYAKLLKNFPFRQDMLHTSKTKGEMIDEHLRNLHKQNNIKQKEVPLPLEKPENSLLSYFNQGDFKSALSMQEKNYESSTSSLLQENDLYRLRLEYKILDNLMKNINDTKRPPSTTTSGYDESLVKTFDTKNVQLLKFLPNESFFDAQKRPKTYSKKHPSIKGTKVDGDNNNRTNFIPDNSGQTEKYNSEKYSWANLNQLNQRDNYTQYLAGAIKDFYLQNGDNFDSTPDTKKYEMEVANSEQSQSVSTESWIPTSSFKPEFPRDEKTVNIGNRIKYATKDTKSINQPVSESYVFSNSKTAKSNEKLTEEILRNGMGTYKPIYNSNGKIETSYVPENQSFDVNVVNFPSKAVPFQVINNESHKKAVHFGLDFVPNTTMSTTTERDSFNKKRTESPYDYEIGGFDDDDDDDDTTTENYRIAPKRNLDKSFDTALGKTDYDNYQGNSKNAPLKKWTFNNTDAFKKNSAINFGKLSDFLDIVKHNLPKDETLAQKKETSEKVKNAIFNDIQQHFENPTEDMSAESSYFIESKERMDTFPDENMEEFQTSISNKKTKLKLPNYYRENKEVDDSMQSALLSTNVPQGSTDMKELSRHKVLIDNHKNESVRTIETTISAYSNIRKGKDIVSNKTLEDHSQNMSKGSNKKKVTNSTLNVDPQNYTTVKRDPREQTRNTKISSINKNVSKTDGFSQKVAIVTPVNVSSLNQMYESTTDNSYINQGGFQIFDLFNTFGNAISKIYEPDSNLVNVEVTEKRNVTPKVVTSTARSIFPTIAPETTTSTMSTPPIKLEGKENITVHKSSKKRGTYKMSNVKGPDLVQFNVKTNVVTKNKANESTKHVRKFMTDSPGPSLNSRMDSYQTSDSEVTLKDTKNIRTTGEKISGSVHNQVRSEMPEINASNISNYNDYSDNEPVRILPMDRNQRLKTSSTASSIAPTPERVTVKSVQQIERVKVKNRIKEKLENSTKKSLPKNHNYMNNSEILEKRKKNLERLMFGFRLTTPPGRMTQVTDKKIMNGPNKPDTSIQVDRTVHGEMKID